jgi:hypothetical protein
MLPAGAFAVALFLNGIQIIMPTPAFVQEGRVWAPGRVVLERVGCKVRWQPSPRGMVVTREGQRLTFAEVSPPWPVPKSPAEALYARREGGLLYVPLLALRNLGVEVSWDGGARRALIEDLRNAGSSLATVLADPVRWLGRVVTLTGEYLGWDAYPACWATAQGQPVGGGDWVLGNEDGAIYCTPGPPISAGGQAGLAAAPSPRPPLTPYSALGRRLKVSGQVQLAPWGAPYVQYDAVETVGGAQ